MKKQLLKNIKKIKTEVNNKKVFNSLYLCIFFVGMLSLAVGCNSAKGRFEMEQKNMKNSLRLANSDDESEDIIEKKSSNMGEVKKPEGEENDLEISKLLEELEKIKHSESGYITPTGKNIIMTESGYITPTGKNIIMTESGVSSPQKNENMIESIHLNTDGSKNIVIKNFYEKQNSGLSKNFKKKKEEDFNCYRQDVYEPQRQDMYIPQRQDMYIPQRQDMYIPQRQDMYRPQRQDMYRPQGRGIHLPNRSELNQTDYYDALKNKKKITLKERKEIYNKEITNIGNLIFKEIDNAKRYDAEILLSIIFGKVMKETLDEINKFRNVHDINFSSLKEGIRAAIYESNFKMVKVYLFEILQFSIKSMKETEVMMTKVSVINNEGKQRLRKKFIKSMIEITKIESKFKKILQTDRLPNTLKRLIFETKIVLYKSLKEYNDQLNLFEKSKIFDTLPNDFQWTWDDDLK